TFASRCDREAVTGEPPSGSTPEFLHPPERAEEAHQTEVSGVVVRELPLEEDEAEARPRAKPMATDDPELERMLAELPPWKLEAPLPGSCRVRAWQGGQQVAPDVQCGPDGSYSLALAPDTSGTVHVEM